MEHYYVSNENGYFFDVSECKELTNAFSDEDCITKVCEVLCCSEEEVDLSKVFKVKLNTKLNKWYIDGDEVVGSLLNAMDNYEW